MASGVFLIGDRGFQDLAAPGPRGAPGTGDPDPLAVLLAERAPLAYVVAVCATYLGLACRYLFRRMLGVRSDRA